ncbi:hypothetical protein O1R50_22840 [Glycomyces luteolus]|uniref:Fibronectin type-III domain-containing protein n=1 Tax=Glycomyces luteolus TaxID=2670330 RepID=A0A9X3PEY7_9ACTN|nr:hypothetical protein [Glycomyces luteolus]MDA1362477.1 hypothetical protein [Glycomyces luteolus]
MRRRTLVAAGLAGAAAPSALAAFGPEEASAAEVQRSPAHPVTAEPSGLLDEIRLGEADSEAAHAFSSPASAVVDAEHGQSARVAKALSPAEVFLGDLVFTMAVDPAAQNYLTLKVSGSDASGFKTAVWVDGQLTGNLMNGDFDPVNMGYGAGLPGRFVFETALLPLQTTQGKSEVEVALRTYNAGLVAPAAADSRRFYAVYTHTSAAVFASEEDGTGYETTTQVAAPRSQEQIRAQVASYEARQLALFNSLGTAADAGTPMSINRYTDNLRFYAEGIDAAWTPLATAADQRAALERIFASIDHYTTEYYGNVTKIGNGGHQSDWGGYYAALGEALYIVENLIADDAVLGRAAFEAFLAEPFDTGTEAGDASLASAGWDGGALTRFGAWERVLKANFDFARTRQSYITNQVMYTYEGAWKAHEGLRVIGSDFYEGKARSNDIVRECLLGTKPWLGEEVLVGPDGEALDLTHSLFQHDRNAVFTDDFVQVVMKGLAKSALDEDGSIVRVRPYGDAYTNLTRDALARENAYVGNYGETQNYLPSWFFRTLGHEGDEELNAEILKTALRNLHSRSYTRYQGTDAAGNRIMFMQQMVDSRNIQYPGRVAYGPDRPSGRGMLWASLEHHMAEHEADYAGDEWDPYWSYAAAAVGAMQQQLLDNQYFNDFNAVLNQHRYDLRFAVTWEYVTSGRASYDRFGRVGAGVMLPHTDFDRYTDEELASIGVDRGSGSQFAFVDIDNLLVSARDAGTSLFVHLNYLNRGFAGNGRVHAIRDGYDHTGQIATAGVFSYQDYTIRADATELAMFYDRFTPSPPDRALVGEILPITHQPGLGVLDRDNWQTDTPLSGYPDLIWARYGEYFIAVNTTRDSHGNAAGHDVAVPASGTVRDLVSGKDLQIESGRITLRPFTAVVLKLDSSLEEPTGPGRVDLVVATPGAGETGLSWSRARGAEAYTVERKMRRDGDWETVAEDVTGTAFIDTEAPRGGTVHYRVIAIGGGATGPASTPIAVEGATPATAGLGGTWLDCPIGDAEGSAARRGAMVTLTDVAASGFAGGDDAVIQRRYGSDSLYAATQLTGPESRVTARLDGTASGVMLRDATAGRARYVYLGTGEDGQLELRTRSLDTRSDIGTSRPGVPGGEYGPTRSPAVEDVELPSAADRPYVSLQREGTTVTAAVSADGADWETVASVTVPMVAVVHAGVASTAETAVFTEVHIS